MNDLVTLVQRIKETAKIGSASAISSMRNAYVKLKVEIGKIVNHINKDVKTFLKKLKHDTTSLKEKLANVINVKPKASERFLKDIKELLSALKKLSHNKEITLKIHIDISGNFNKKIAGIKKVIDELKTCKGVYSCCFPCS